MRCATTASACLTWDQAQEVWGWTLLETDGLFLTVCSITEQGEDRVYFVISRVVNNATRYYVERMSSELWQDQDDACFLDCAKSWINDTPVAVFDRLDHLEGRTVVAWVDGSKVSVDPSGNPLVVRSGQVTLASPGYKVSIGLPFAAELQTLPLAVQTGGSGWNVARPQEASRALARVVNTRDLYAGIDADHLYLIKQREDEAYGDPTDLITGDLDIELDGLSGSSGVSVFLRSSDPTPMEIAAVLIEPKFGDMS
jgi:hypothetical protein